MPTTLELFNLDDAEVDALLDGRTATCGGGVNGEGHAPRLSSLSLPFFEYRGEGSDWQRHCDAQVEKLGGRVVGCGFFDTVHQEVNPHTGRPGITDHEFVQRPPAERDSYYCGCRGWD